MRTYRKGLIVTGLLIVSLVVGGVVVAQEPANPTATPTPSIAGQNGTGLWGRGLGLWERFMGWMGHRTRVGTSLVETVAKELDLTVADVTGALADGQSLEQIIQAHNGDAQAILDSYIAAHKTLLDQAVANGRLTQEQADQQLAELRTRAEQQLTSTDWPTRVAPLLSSRWMGAGTNLVSTVAKELDMTVADVTSALADGQSLEQIIQAHNGDAQAILDSYIAAHETLLDQAVANGRLTQEQADQQLSELRTRAEQQLTSTDWPACGAPMLRRHGMRGGGFGAPDQEATPTPSTTTRTRGSASGMVGV